MSAGTEYSPECPPAAGCEIFHFSCDECDKEWCQIHSPAHVFEDAIECPDGKTVCPECRDDHEAICSACADQAAADWADEQAVLRWKGEL